MAYTLTPNVALPYGQGSQFIPNNSDGIVNIQTGGFTMDATATVAVVIPVGFNPRKFRLVDITALAQWELMDQMASGNCIKTTYASGARSDALDTTGIITVGAENGATEREVTIAAAALTASHSYIYEAVA